MCAVSVCAGGRPPFATSPGRTRLGSLRRAPTDNARTLTNAPLTFLLLQSTHFNSPKMMKTLALTLALVACASAMELTPDTWATETAGKSVFVKFLGESVRRTGARPSSSAPCRPPSLPTAPPHPRPAHMAYCLRAP